jgi:hypothetical protein
VVANVAGIRAVIVQPRGFYFFGCSRWRSYRLRANSGVTACAARFACRATCFTG